ncbi:hypothetical protein [Paraclostridium sordellii]|uniref:hypothetical protein n=1 Tax=Paraclostridium sordellii TaxID=1505 RepID=UPI0018CE1EF1|nr:hypothetical protein [Paeniclostridium sordellii]MCH1966391.1 hypothetical protein [Paeniclostridium sordellii]
MFKAVNIDVSFNLFLYCVSLNLGTKTAWFLSRLTLSNPSLPAILLYSEFL